jgi:hypothetical protein
MKDGPTSEAIASRTGCNKVGCFIVGTGWQTDAYPIVKVGCFIVGTGWQTDA